MTGENNLVYINADNTHLTSTIFQGNSEDEPMLKLCQNGDIYVKGKLVENDKEVVNGMRDLLGLTQQSVAYND